MAGEKSMQLEKMFGYLVQLSSAGGGVRSNSKKEGTLSHWFLAPSEMRGLHFLWDLICREFGGLPWVFYWCIPRKSYDRVTTKEWCEFLCKTFSFPYRIAFNLKKIIASRGAMGVQLQDIRWLDWFFILSNLSSQNSILPRGLGDSSNKGNTMSLAKTEPQAYNVIDSTQLLHAAKTHKKESVRLAEGEGYLGKWLKSITPYYDSKGIDEECTEVWSIAAKITENLRHTRHSPDTSGKKIRNSQDSNQTDSDTNAGENDDPINNRPYNVPFARWTELNRVLWRKSWIDPLAKITYELRDRIHRGKNLKAKACESQLAEAVDGRIAFKHVLMMSSGNHTIASGWREFLDPCARGYCTFQDFVIGCRLIRFNGWDLETLFKSLTRYQGNIQEPTLTLRHLNQNMWRSCAYFVKKLNKHANSQANDLVKQGGRGNPHAIGGGYGASGMIGSGTSNHDGNTNISLMDSNNADDFLSDPSAVNNEANLKLLFQDSDAAYYREPGEYRAAVNNLFEKQQYRLNLLKERKRRRHANMRQEIIDKHAWKKKKIERDEKKRQKRTSTKRDSRNSRNSKNNRTSSRGSRASSRRGHSLMGTDDESDVFTTPENSDGEDEESLAKKAASTKFLTSIHDELPELDEELLHKECVKELAEIEEEERKSRKQKDQLRHLNKGQSGSQDHFFSNEENPNIGSIRKAMIRLLSSEWFFRKIVEGAGQTNLFRVPNSKRKGVIDAHADYESGGKQPPTFEDVEQNPEKYSVLINEEYCRFVRSHLNKIVIQLEQNEVDVTSIRIKDYNLMKEILSKLYNINSRHADIDENHSKSHTTSTAHAGTSSASHSKHHSATDGMMEYCLANELCQVDLPHWHPAATRLAKVGQSNMRGEPVEARVDANDLKDELEGLRGRDAAPHMHIQELQLRSRKRREREMEIERLKKEHEIRRLKRQRENLDEDGEGGDKEDEVYKKLMLMEGDEEAVMLQNREIEKDRLRRQVLGIDIDYEADAKELLEQERKEKEENDKKAILRKSDGIRHNLHDSLKARLRSGEKSLKEVDEQVTKQTLGALGNLNVNINSHSTPVGGTGTVVPKKNNPLAGGGPENIAHLDRLQRIEMSTAAREGHRLGWRPAGFRLISDTIELKPLQPKLFPHPDVAIKKYLEMETKKQNAYDEKMEEVLAAREMGRQKVQDRLDRTNAKRLQKEAKYGNIKGDKGREDQNKEVEMEGPSALDLMNAEEAENTKGNEDEKPKQQQQQLLTDNDPERASEGGDGEGEFDDGVRLPGSMNDADPDIEKSEKIDDIEDVESTPSIKKTGSTSELKLKLKVVRGSKNKSTTGSASLVSEGNVEEPRHHLEDDFEAKLTPEAPAEEIIVEHIDEGRQTPANILGNIEVHTKKP